MRKRTATLIVLAAVAPGIAGVALATPPSGLSSQLLARGAGGELRIHDVELDEQFAKRDFRRQPVDDDAHGAVAGMRTHIYNRAGKTLVAHAWHGDQELAAQEAFRRAPCHD